MDKVVILQGLNPNVMPSVVNIEEIVEESPSKQEQSGNHSQRQVVTEPTHDKPSASAAKDPAESDRDADHTDPSEHADEHGGEFDFDLNFGAPDGNSLEELGTLLSAFFQDDKGTNVVDAIRENSRVHLKIARTLEKILKVVEKKS